MKVFWLDDQKNNLGDNLNKPILEWLGYKVEYTTKRNHQGKFVGIGSIMSSVRPNDIVWGTGIIRENQNLSPAHGAKFLAVRGKKTHRQLRRAGIKCPEVYGDPALLLPLIYNPEIEPIYEVGYIPHYIDKPLVKAPQGSLFIDIQTLDYKHVIDQILQCRKIITSSLHGIILAEAYDRKVEWVQYSDNVIGGEFKFRDYLTGTERPEQSYGELPILDKNVLKHIQDGLIKALKDSKVV